MITIYPAIDVIEGKCVRLTQGDYAQKKIYNSDPLDMAMRFEQHGLKYLHLVDLDGAREKRVINYRVIERICNKTRLLVDFGGGLAGDEDIRIAFESGVDKVNIGSVAVKDRDLCLRWIERYGAEKIILSADARKEKIVVSGWQEGTDVWVYDLVEQYQQAGLKQIACTDVDCDGMMQGSSHALYQKLHEKFPDIRITASGGVSSIAEIEKLQEMGLHGAIVGRAIYEGTIQLQDFSPFL